MAATPTVYTPTQANAIADDESINPDISSAHQQVQITLVFDNPVTAVDVNADIYDAINDKFATIGTNHVPARGTYVFYVSA